MHLNILCVRPVAKQTRQLRHQPQSTTHLSCLSMRSLPSLVPYTMPPPKTGLNVAALTSSSKLGSTRTSDISGTLHHNMHSIHSQIGALCGAARCT